MAKVGMRGEWGSIELSAVMWWTWHGRQREGELEMVVGGWKMNENWTMDKQKPNIQQMNLNRVWNDKLWRIESSSDQLCMPSKLTNQHPSFSINQPQPPDILQMLSMLITEDIIVRSWTLFLTNDALDSDGIDASGTCSATWQSHQSRVSG